MKDSENSSEAEKDFGKKSLNTTKEEENAGYAKSMDTYSGIAHNQSITFVTKLGMSQ